MVVRQPPRRAGGTNEMMQGKMENQTLYTHIHGSFSKETEKHSQGLNQERMLNSDTWSLEATVKP